MSILLTGATSFLGNKIISLHQDLNFDTLGRSKVNSLIYDICEQIPYLIKDYDYVIHIAGKAHDNSKSAEVKNQYFETNYSGTLNLLNALEKNTIKHFVYISSVAVYGLVSGSLVTESADLLATDPYGLSKLKAETAVIDWCEKKNVKCTILRLPLIVGSDAPGNLKNMINGIRKGYYFNVDGGKARKSMVLVDDVAKFIFKAGQVGGIFNLTDGVHPTFYDLSTHISLQLNKKKPLDLPFWFAKFISKTGDILGSNSPFNTVVFTKMTSDLTFDDTHARNIFNWNPTPVLKSFILS
jgi:nucleoside-diphosphate-sugar epimerase